MLVAGFPAGSFQTNCFVVAPDEGGPCVVVDPGQDAEEPLRKVLAERRLTPVAVLLTHGHLDHMWSVTPVCDGDDIPAWIHPEDRFMLADPLKGVGEMGAQLAAMYPGLEFREPQAGRDPRRRRHPGARRAEPDRRPHPGPHPRLGRLPQCHRGRRAVRAGRGHPVPGQHRAHRPPGRLARGDDDEPARPSSSRCPTRPRCCPGTGRRPPSATSGTPTRSCRARPNAPGRNL